MRSTIIATLLAIFLGGCVTSTINTTRYNAPPSDIGNIAVASFFIDEVSGVRSNGWSASRLPETKVFWETNKNCRDLVVRELEKNNINAVEANYDTSVFKKIGGETEEEVVLEISKLLRANMSDAKVDSFIILTQNSIDIAGRQHSALRNFGLMGPMGVILGEIGKNKAYSPSFKLLMNIGLNEKRNGKSRCLVGFDMYMVDAKTNQILAKSKSAIGLHEVSNDVWGENITEYSRLDDVKIKDACLNALDEGVTNALMDIGLIPSVEQQTRNTN